MARHLPPGQDHRELGPPLAAARAAARDDLRARWAAADAEYDCPLANGLTRIARDKLQAVTEAEERLAALRDAYAAELRTLSFTARAAELHRLTDQLEQS